MGRAGVARGRRSPGARRRGVSRGVPRASAAEADDPLASEAAGWKKRAEESRLAGVAAPNGGGEWRWTLNWDDITDQIVVGSCPRSVGDADALVDEARATAVLCLQSDACFKALDIPWEDIRRRLLERSAVSARVQVRDFDHNDQATMLPEAVRTLADLIGQGKRVYVHCTAGINRANLTVVGYLTFVKGWELDAAVEMVRTKRPCAHPYLDCWQSVRTRLLEGHAEELTRRSRAIYDQRRAEGRAGDMQSDWDEAERGYIQDVFARRLAADATVLDSLVQIGEIAADAARARAATPASTEAEPASDARDAEVEDLRTQVKELSVRNDEAVARADTNAKRADAAEARVRELQVALATAKAGAIMEGSDSEVAALSADDEVLANDSSDRSDDDALRNYCREFPTSQLCANVLDDNDPREAPRRGQAAGASP